MLAWHENSIYLFSFDLALEPDIPVILQSSLW